MKYLITYGFKAKGEPVARTVEINEHPIEWLQRANRLKEDYFLIMIYKL